MLYFGTEAAGPAALRGAVHQDDDAVGSGNGSGFSSTVLTTEKMAVLAPIPRASAEMAVAVKPGLWRNMRKACLTSAAIRVVRRRLGGKVCGCEKTQTTKNDRLCRSVPPGSRLHPAEVLAEGDLFGLLAGRFPVGVEPGLQFGHGHVMGGGGEFHEESVESEAAALEFGEGERGGFEE